MDGSKFSLKSPTNLPNYYIVAGLCFPLNCSMCATLILAWVETVLATPTHAKTPSKILATPPSRCGGGGGGGGGALEA